MEIIVNSHIKIQVDDEKLVTWSYDEFTGIVTLNFKDSTWKFEKEFNKFYKLD